MIDPIEPSFECFNGPQAGCLGALDHDHLDAELPRRLNLRIGRRAATVCTKFERHDYRPRRR